MTRTTKIAIAAVAGGLVAAAAIGGAVVATTDDEGDERPITGEAYERASQAALDHVGEGRVTDTEEGDEESYYEVEVTLDDGSEVDVQLDREFTVVGTEPEDGPDDD